MGRGLCPLVRRRRVRRRRPPVRGESVNWRFLAAALTGLGVFLARVGAAWTEALEPPAAVIPEPLPVIRAPVASWEPSQTDHALALMVEHFNPGFALYVVSDRHLADRSLPSAVAYRVGPS